jgi:hypothetical protein
MIHLPLLVYLVALPFYFPFSGEEAQGAMLPVLYLSD